MHLAGIIPVAQLVTDHESITPDVLTLLEPRFTAIQNAVIYIIFPQKFKI